MSSTKIVYEDIAVGASEVSKDSVSTQQPFSKLVQIKTGAQYPSYASLGELNQTVLNGERQTLPVSPENIGWWSAQQSDLHGNFATPPKLTRTLSGLFTTVGMTFEFDAENNLFATDLDVEYYRGQLLLARENYKPTKPQYFAQRNVTNFDKVVIIFNKMNMPISYLKLHKCDFGVIRVFLGDELKNVKVLEEISLISEEISVNSMNFTLESAENTDFIFQKKQRLKLFFKDALRGLFFIDKSTRIAKNVYTVDAVDYIGQMDKTYFKGGIYRGKNAFELAGDIFGSIPFEMETALKSKIVTGWVPITTCRNALLQLAFAIGAVVDTTQSEKVALYSLSNDVVTTFSKTDVMFGQSFGEEDKATEIQLTEHNYTEGAEVKELFKDSIGNNIPVNFSEPMHSLTIINGTIVQSGANFAVINASAGCVLSGKGYTDNQRIISIKNPILSAGDLENIIKFEQSTLISKGNSQEVAQKVYNYYAGMTFTNSKIKTTAESVGDMVELETAYLGTKRGRIVSMSYGLNGNNVVAQAVIKND